MLGCKRRGLGYPKQIYHAIPRPTLPYATITNYVDQYSLQEVLKINSILELYTWGSGYLYRGVSERGLGYPNQIYNPAEPSNSNPNDR